MEVGKRSHMPNVCTVHNMIFLLDVTLSHIFYNKVHIITEENQLLVCIRQLQN